MQQMLSVNRGTEILKASSDSLLGPLFWVASRRDSTQIVKLANYGLLGQSVTISFPKATKAQVTMLSSSNPATTSNTPGKEVILPQTKYLPVSNGAVTVQMPSFAVAVVVVS